MDQKKQLNILGFYDEAINIILESAEISMGIRDFKVLLNMDCEPSEYYVAQDRYQVNFFECHKNKYFFGQNDLFALGVIGIKSKEIVFDFFKKYTGYSRKQFPNLIHPTSPVSKSSQLSNGVFIDALTSVHVLAQIGFGVTIKNNCYIGHHSIIGDFVTINPGVTLNGIVKIGNNTLIGADSIIRDGINIGSNSIIGMGSNVVKDIPDNVVALGNPCRVIRENR